MKKILFFSLVLAMKSALSQNTTPQITTLFVWSVTEKDELARYDQLSKNVKKFAILERNEYLSNKDTVAIIMAVFTNKGELVHLLLTNEQHELMVKHFKQNVVIRDVDSRYTSGLKYYAKVIERKKKILTESQKYFIKGYASRIDFVVSDSNFEICDGEKKDVKIFAPNTH